MVLSEPHGAALKVGPHATRIAEPRQARKGATVRRPSRVPWEYLTGAGVVGRSQDCSFEGGCTVIVLEREAGLNRGWRVRGTCGSAVLEREAGLNRGWRVRGTRGGAVLERGAGLNRGGGVGGRGGAPPWAPPWAFQRWSRRRRRP